MSPLSKASWEVRENVRQIAQSIESASRGLISELPSLAKGQAIISGLAINTPTPVMISKRLTRAMSGGGGRMRLRCGRRRGSMRRSMRRLR